VAENPQAFKYWNGTADIHLDPSETRRKLIHSLGGKYAQIIADYSAGIEPAQAGNPDAEPTVDPELEPVRFQATEHILMAAREVFALPKVDGATGQGVGEDHVIAVFWEFLEFCEDAKKKRVASPTSSPSTEPVAFRDLSTDTPASVLTSISIESCCGQQLP